jgi:hypothetical protein
MSRSTHAAAVLEEDGELVAVVVRVEVDLLDHLGDEAVYDTVTNHPWVLDHGVPLVLGYKSQGELSFVGPEDVSDIAAEYWTDLKWKNKISIDWDELEEDILDEDIDEDAEDVEDDEYEDDDKYDEIDDEVDEVVDDEVADDDDET